MKSTGLNLAAWVLAACMACAVGSPARSQPAAPAAATPGSSAPFAYKSQLEGDGQPGLHRVQVPLSVYDTARDAQLRDLRVYDASGAPVPFAWVDRGASAGDLAIQAPVPMFTINGRGARNPGERMPLPVERAEDGTLAASRDADKDGRTAIGAIFDLSRTAGDIQALVFADYRSTTPFHSFSLEASDDLKKWTLLRQEAQIVRLKQDDRVLQQNSVELGFIPVESARYLRLLWRDPKTAPELQRMEVRASTNRQRPRAILWTEPQSPVATSQATYEYTTAPALPIDRLRVNLSRTNTMAPVLVERYEAGAAPRAGAPGQPTAAPAGAWKEVTRSVAYRLESGVTEIVAPDMTLDSLNMPRFRVTVDNRGNAGNAPAPTIQVGFYPRTLIFNAKGPGPYLLAWGRNTERDASVPPETLMPGYTGLDTLPDSATPWYPTQRLAAADFRVPDPDAATIAATSQAKSTVGSFLPSGQSLFTALLVLIDLALAVLLVRTIVRGRRSQRRR